MFDTVWQNIQRRAGETFHQVRGKAFQYEAHRGYLKPSTTNQNISRSDFERAFAHRPLRNVRHVNNLGVRGPSYVFAILTDPRIAGNGAQAQGRERSAHGPASGIDAGAPVKVADEIWVAAARLHRDHPQRPDFSVAEIVQRAVVENLAGGFRPGLQVHAAQHCVASKPPNPPSAQHRILSETSRGRRRLFRPGDPFHPMRAAGKTSPRESDLPASHRYLLDWYEKHFLKGEASSSAGLPPGISGKEFLALVRPIPEDDLQRMEEAIQECERVDLNEW